MTEAAAVEVVAKLPRWGAVEKSVPGTRLPVPSKDSISSKQGLKIRSGTDENWELQLRTAYWVPGTGYWQLFLFTHEILGDFAEAAF